MASNGCATSLKTVVVLGGAYGGARAAQLIAAGLPDGWRIVLIDRNSHVNHVYILPRLAVLAGHEHKAFVPYDNVFNLPDSDSAKHDSGKYTFIQAHIHSLSANCVTLSRYGQTTEETLHFDYAVYALGSHLPSPLNLWHAAPDGKPAGHGVHAYGGTKAEGIAWLRGKQRTIEEAGSVLVVGGGALGIQFATDIAAVHPGKRVTLLHSRARLLPRFDSAMHTETPILIDLVLVAVLQALESANVDVILGERLDLVSSSSPGRNTVCTTTGRVIQADLVVRLVLILFRSPRIIIADPGARTQLLCTGQRPNTELLAALDARTVDPGSALVHVLRTMQLAPIPPSPSPPLPELVPAPAPDVDVDVLEHSPAPEDELAAALAQIALLDDDASSSPPSSPLSPSSPSSPDTSDSAADAEPDTEATSPYPHVFVIGDAADAFGAIPAGHNAYFQAEVAARNLLRLVAAEGESADERVELERYTPGPPAIKVSLGLPLPTPAPPPFPPFPTSPPSLPLPNANLRPPQKKNVYQVNGVVGIGKEARDDLNAAAIWPYFGCPVTEGEADAQEGAGEGGMYR
ncbi:Apoptosis-inducing factor B [Mycena venus]|uniref:Apoptosis-inducing factor B n=1 Tax=Mycena venus TaxID=2733690 RepID=A0A8H6YHS8_9AGAR|nr:Apoptosis-inducing factor B [Mycena venus]